MWYTALSIFLYIIAFILISMAIFLFIKAVSRNRDTKALSLDSEIHIDEYTLQPVIPRHVRDQLLIQTEAAPVVTEAKTQVIAVEKLSDDVDDTLEKKSLHDDALYEGQSLTNTETTEGHFQLNPDIEVKAIEDFQGESELLIANLEEEESFSENAEQVMEFYVYLDDTDLKGDRFLKILDRYGLRFGEENYFHRYHEDENGQFYPMFSLAKRTYEGTTESFDINTLPNEPINAVVFFLTLPHYDAVMGYDMMMTSMHRMARELKGRIFDAHRNELSLQMEEDLRNAIKEYTQAE